MGGRPLRRSTIVAGLLLGALVLPLVGQAQRSTPPRRVGVLSPFSRAGDPFLTTLREGMRELGYTEGRDLAFESRSAEGLTDRLPGLAAELTRLSVDVIVTTTPAAVQAARQATTSIPIVIAGVDDAVSQGFVDSLSRPGGNVTGTSWLNTELSAKRLELLREALPGVTRVAVLREAVGGAAALRATEVAAGALGVRLQVIEIRDADEFESAFAAMSHGHVGAVLVMPGPMITGRQQRIVSLMFKSRLPAMFSEAGFVRAGGLMSYGPRLLDSYRQAASYVDRILKGARPGDLPVEQPRRFELVVNLRTARELRLTLPQSVLLRADELIE
jgi:putative ABC transport system substrate-binding protein